MQFKTAEDLGLNDMDQVYWALRKLHPMQAAPGPESKPGAKKWSCYPKVQNDISSTGSFSSRLASVPTFEKFLVTALHVGNVKTPQTHVTRSFNLRNAILVVLSVCWIPFMVTTCQWPAFITTALVLCSDSLVHFLPIDIWRWLCWGFLRAVNNAIFLVYRPCPTFIAQMQWGCRLVQIFF